MERIYLTLVATAVICGTTVSALCDNATAAKIQICTFKSDLLVPLNFPKSGEEVTSYCGANATINCIATERGGCSGNARQLKLMDNLVTYQHVMDGNALLCNDTAIETQTDCFAMMNGAEKKTCLSNAVGALENAGDLTDLKESLDTMCTFFDAYAACFPDECSIFRDAVKGLAYHYCMLNEVERQQVVTEYETGVSGAAISTLNVFSIIAAIVAVLYL